MIEISDIELIRLVAEENSGEAFSQLFDRYAHRIKLFCRNMIDDHDQVDDIFQGTFIAFYNNIKEGKVIGFPSTYLYSIARNHCYKYFRDKKDNVPIDPNKLFHDESCDLEKDEMLEIIYSCTQLLENKYKEVFLLREMEGLSYKEIADICGLSVSGAKTRYRRAFQALMKVMTPYIKDLQNNIG